MNNKIVFMLAATDHGMMIVHRLDYRQVEGGAYGVGYNLLETSAYETEIVQAVVQQLTQRRKTHGNGVVLIDCGANIGALTLPWAMHMRGWGFVLAIEAQLRLFYALCGNITMNNLFNVEAVNAVIGNHKGTARVPRVDYSLASSYGSLEINPKKIPEFIGQKIDYDKGVLVQATTLDSLNLQRVDFIKLDIEGMELEALEGADATIRRDRPVLLVEKIKVDDDELRRWFDEYSYRYDRIGLNYLAIPLIPERQ